MKKKIALILGITGQDGSYLAKYLLDKGYKVFGTTRDIFTANKVNLKKLGIEKKVNLVTTSITDFRSLIFTLEKTNPDLIFHLAGQTSVGLSFQLPFEAIESISISTLNLLESVRFFNKKIKIFLPCSSDCFGSLIKENPANENTPLNPMSPYAVAKSSSYWLANTYKNSYGMSISVCFLSNHESPLRGKHFVTSKLVNQINKIKNKEIDKLYFGNIDIVRDWGWAPSYVDAIFRVMQKDDCDNYIIASGKSYSLRCLIQKTFEIAGLGSYEKYVEVNSSEKRPNEIKACYLDPSKAKNQLCWVHDLEIEAIIYKLLNKELF